MSWTWLIIILVIALIISPIATLMPTKRQRASARLRTHAAIQGLRVRMAELSSGEAKYSGTILPIYTLPWQSEQDKALTKLPSWQLVRIKYSHEIHFFHDWDWGSKSLKAEDRWLQPLFDLFTQAQSDPLFDRFQVLEWNAQGVQIAWTESAAINDVDRIVQLLQELKAFAKGEQQTLHWPPG